MGDRLVIWSGGGRYVASKDVATAAIVEPSIKTEVNWGGSDIVILDGGNAEISTPALGFWNCIYLYYGTYYYFSAEGYEWENVRFNRRGQAGCSFYSELIGDFRTVYRYVSCNGYVTSVELFWDSESIGNLVETPSIYTDPLPQNVWRKVTTDKDDFSQRQTDQNPLLTSISGNCAIAVTFADSTSIEIPLSYCPEWVQVKPQNSCPDGTARECHHGATVCCFGCQDGRLTLIDQFNKVS